MICSVNGGQKNNSAKVSDVVDGTGDVRRLVKASFIHLVLFEWPTT